MKNIAVIPARGGSKGIPDKNIYKINDKTLIDFSIETLINVKGIDDIIVSTDSKKIKEHVNLLWPSIIVVDRPSSISGDDDISETAILHSIEYYEKNIEPVDKVLFVQCTSPLTTSKDFTEVLNMLDYYDSVGCYVEDYGFFFDEALVLKPRIPRQKRNPKKRECGNVWGMHASSFKININRLYGNYGLYKIDQNRTLEIDEPSDLVLLKGLIDSV